jgi:DNA-binding CsgD family transcriptional regulator
LQRPTDNPPEAKRSAPSCAVALAASWIERQGLLRCIERSTLFAQVIDLGSVDLTLPGTISPEAAVTVVTVPDTLDRLQRSPQWTSWRALRDCSWLLACTSTEDAQRAVQMLAGVAGNVATAHSASELTAALSRHQPVQHHLSGRQQEVLSMVRSGLSNKAIAACLGVAPGTVKNHVSTLLKLHGASNRTQLATVRIGAAHVTSGGLHLTHPPG